MDNKKDERTLQEMLKTLDEQIRALESEDISLEDSFGIYEQGMKLIKECNDKIDRVEKQLLQIQVRVGKHFRIVHVVNGFREQCGDRAAVFVHFLQGGNDHPVEGEDHDQRHKEQEGVDHCKAQDFQDSLPCRYLVHIPFAHGFHFRHDRHLLNNGSSFC